MPLLGTLRYRGAQSRELRRPILLAGCHLELPQFRVVPLKVAQPKEGPDRRSRDRPPAAEKEPTPLQMAAEQEFGGVRRGAHLDQPDPLLNALTSESGTSRRGATVGLHRPIARLQDRSRCQWAISITVAAERAGYRDGEEWTKSGAQRSPTCIWMTEEFDKQWEIARKQGKLG